MTHICCTAPMNFLQATENSLVLNGCQALLNKTIVNCHCGLCQLYCIVLTHVEPSICFCFFFLYLVLASTIAVRCICIFSCKCSRFMFTWVLLVLEIALSTHTYRIRIYNFDSPYVFCHIFRLIQQLTQFHNCAIAESIFFLFL